MRTSILTMALASTISVSAFAAKDPFLATLSGHKGPVFAVAYSPDGSKMLSASFDGTLKLWDAGARREISTWEGHTDNVRAAAFSPDGSRAVSGGSDRQVKYWNTESGTEVESLSGHEGIIRCVAFSPDGKRFLSGSDDKTLRLWAVGSSTGSPRLEAAWRAHSDGVNACAFSPDGKTALSGSQDKTVILWDVAAGKPIDTWTGHSAPVLAVAYSPDGKLAFSGGGDSEVRVWDLADRKQLSRWTGHTDEINFIVVSPDNSLALTGGRDKTIKLWDIPSRQPLATFSGGENFIYSAAFAPDGKRAVFGLGDILRILDVEAVRPPKSEVKSPQKLSTKVSLAKPDNGILDPEVKGILQVAVTNSGGLPAQVRLVFKAPSVEGFSGLKEPGKPLDVRAGKTVTLEFPVSATRSVATGAVPIDVQAKDGNGFDAEPVGFQLKTRAFEAPRLSLEDVKVGGGGTIRLGEPAVVTMKVKNSGGIAWSVEARFAGAAAVGGVVKALSDSSVKLGDLEPGESKPLELKFQVPPSYKGENALPLSVSLSEKRPLYNISALPLGLELAR